MKNLLVLNAGNEGMIHWLTINNHPSNPQQPIHSLRLAPVRKKPWLWKIAMLLMGKSIISTGPWLQYSYVTHYQRVHLESVSVLHVMVYLVAFWGDLK